MKKTFFISLSFIVYTTWLNAQCVANAGGNKHICQSGGFPTASIGGTPTASGGTPPYTYCWSTDTIHLYPGSNLVFTASDVLNDTTVANPTIIDNLGGKTLAFYLKITDALGCVSHDTCTISFSIHIDHLWYYVYHIDEGFINSGDSLPMDKGVNIGSTLYPPYTYSWQPAHGLSTTTLATGFWALPHVSTTYSVTITDAMGCSFGPSAVYHVTVCPAGYVAGLDTSGGAATPACLALGIKENTANNTNFSVYPNPASEMINVESTLTLKGGTVEMYVYDILGNVILNEKVNIENNVAQINVSALKSGMYFIKIGNATQKFVKE